MLGLADGGFAVVARDVVEPDPVVVEVVQDRQAALVPLPVVRLRPLGSAHKWEVSLSVQDYSAYPPVLDQATLL